jgi:hypothetical protein
MVSTLKVNKIQIPNSDSDVISLDASSGNITIPKNVTFSGTVTGDNNDNGMTLLQTQTVSGDTTVDVGSSSLFTSTYKIYQIHIINVHPSNNGAHFACKMGTGGSIISANYEYAREQVLHGGSSIRGANSAGTVDLCESVGNEANEHLCQVHNLYNPAGTTFIKLVNFYGTSVDLTPNKAANNGMYSNEGFVTAIDRIQFYFTAGTMDSGIFKLYGIG